MFCSKVSSLLKQSVNRIQYKNIFPELSSNQIFPIAAYSNDALPTVKSTPDKLYKKIEIEIRAHDPAVMKSYEIFAAMAAKNLDIAIIRNLRQRKPIHERLTLLKSAHVHKKHRVQYETRTYYHFLDIAKVTGSTADTYLEYIQRNLPEGIALKITKTEIQTLPESIREVSCKT